MQEYLAMRDEMNALIRLELSLILGALAVVGGAAATVATGIGGLDTTAQAFILQAVATFGLIIFIAAIGVANSFIILESYVTTAAAEIERLASSSQPRHLASMQRKIRRWTRRRSLTNSIAWLISYGATQILAAVALLIVAGIASIGFLASQSGDPLGILAGKLVGAVDTGLATLALAMLIASLAFTDRWDRVMGE